MIDREQVIRGLELCVSHDSDKCCKCPYHPQCQEYYYTALKEDALTLLKEQEAVEPSFKQDEKGILQEYRNVVDALIDVGYPHNFQREEPWIRDYCYKITGIVKMAYDVMEGKK